jgi:predicted nucleic acid-binding protein
MLGFSVVLDTCAIYPAYLRDTLLRLAAAETYRPRWSAHILDELHRLLTNRIDVASADRIIEAMTRHFPDALVTGYESLIPAMTNHPKDRHVLAAAVRANADAIVTFNLDNFPAAATDPYEIDVLHPDAFLLNQIELAPRRVLHVLDEQVAGYRRPTMDLYSLASALYKAGCTEAAEELRRHIGPT